MVEDKTETFDYTPEPSHYKFRVRLQLDSGLTFKEVIRYTKNALSTEFTRNTNKIHVWEATFQSGERDGEIVVTVKSLSTPQGFDKLEARTSKAMAEEFHQSPEEVSAVCVDTLP